MIYKLGLPLHLQPLHQPQHEVDPYPNVKALVHINTLSEGILALERGLLECMRGLENSGVYHGTNSPGALNVKASVKSREPDSCREHCISREPPGYYFGKRVLLHECSCRWPWSDVLSADFSPGLHHQERDAGLSF